MFVTDKLVFVELHKTGGTHICSLLADLVGGVQEGKHNRLNEKYKDRFILGSIRNPWDWYVSLWAYGCAGEGSVYSQTVRRYDFNYYYRQLPKEMGKNWLSPYEWLKQIMTDSKKPVDLWRWCYEDHDDPERFRCWLGLLLGEGRQYDIGEGFGFSSFSSEFGILTYRYLKLFTHLDERLYSKNEVVDMGQLDCIWDEFSHVDYVVRNENLEEDFALALEQAGIDITDEQRVQLFSRGKKKINTSKRREAAYYYNQKTLDLVAAKERFIIERYGYDMPEIS